MAVIPISVERIDAVLPQTQCGQCGHPGCLPYATALANGEADINRCPPGGDEGIHKLAELLGKPYKPFAEDAPQPRPRALAVIDESICIGCTLCLQACPVDAILGAAKQMHTIIASECTGCELCIAPCPVDCISMEPLPEATRELLLADHWRERHRFRVFRLERDKSEKAQRLAEKSAAKATPISAESQRQVAELGIKTAANELDKKAAIAAAMQRAAEQRASQTAATVNNDEAKQAAIQAAIERAAARKAAALARAAQVNESVLSQPKAGLSDADKKDLIQAAMERAAAMRNAQNEESSKDR